MSLYKTISVFIFLSFFMVHHKAQNMPVCDFNAIVNFGDSNSDTSVVNIKSGESNPKRKHSDGRLIIDFIAEKLKKPYLSAFVDQNQTNYKQGVNFAVSGSVILKPRADYIFPDLANQTGQFSMFKEGRTDDFSKSLFTIDLGQNDVQGVLLLLNLTVIPDIIQHFTLEVKNIYGEGARSFWIHNTGPIGCLANLRKDSPPNSELDEFGCLKFYNDVAKDFNKQLKDSVIQLRTELKDVTMTYVDVYSAKYKLFSNAKNLGFTDPFGSCKNGNITCTNPSKFLLWDGTHYTEAANRLVATAILDGSSSDPPRAIDYNC